ncbi:MAG: 3-deoxy-manno-octulosonate cytidylyltransferase, partial [Pseudomonadota bacterium]|nr:3-deoxy-manno-octulosonate cytidylyltransferase [Pseudomonadota bacterium]
SRLPNKPLADIAGKPMIQHVWERAMAADLAPVYVATDDRTIADVIEKAGGKAVLTRADHPSGSDRVFEAVETIDPQQQIKHVLNLQGDLPDMSADIPHHLATTLDQTDCDLATLVTKATAEEVSKPQVVKAVVSWKGKRFGEALYFSRASVPTGAADKFHHIGVYGWHRSALARFVTLPPSPLEISEKLEQLRALEAGMRIGVAEIDTAPSGVDTDEDLQAARKRFAST